MKQALEGRPLTPDLCCADCALPEVVCVGTLTLASFRRKPLDLSARKFLNCVNADGETNRESGQCYPVG